MSKDRAAPFSRKHRRYWIPVTGGMILIGFVNVAIGLWSYTAPKEPQRIVVDLRRDAGPLDAANTVAVSKLPVPVMRAFAIKYPRTIPSGASVDGDNYTVMFPPGRPRVSAVFKSDGTFVSDQ